MAGTRRFRALPVGVAASEVEADGAADASGFSEMVILREVFLIVDATAWVDEICFLGVA